jgi:hypothetical protein
MDLHDDLNDWNENIFKQAADQIKANQKAKAVMEMVLPEEKKPNRQFKINQDDMINLEIAFNTAKTIDEFLDMV